MFINPAIELVRLFGQPNPVL